jgi:hypothetical protein
MTANPALTQQASRGRDDPVATGLVTRARNGEQQAWDTLVERYAPLIWSICRRHRLEAADAQDAAQNVWLRLVDRHCYCPGNLPTSLDPVCGISRQASCGHGARYRCLIVRGRQSARPAACVRSCPRYRKPCLCSGGRLYLNVCIGLRIAGEKDSPSQRRGHGAHRGR